MIELERLSGELHSLDIRFVTKETHDLCVRALADFKLVDQSRAAVEALRPELRAMMAQISEQKNKLEDF